MNEFKSPALEGANVRRTSPKPVRPSGILHFTLSVTDLDRARKFYEEVVGCTFWRRNDKAVFMRCGEDYFVLSCAGYHTPQNRNRDTLIHHAFLVQGEDFESALAHVEACGVEVLLASKLPENECPPVRVKLLSERLIAWRDTQGRYSLIDEFCAHRGTSLWVGRNEEDGLRCPYHGWKYDWTGQCIDVPSEPPESGFCQRIRLKSYPLVKRGDVLWAYMGPAERQPALPEFEFAMVPPKQSYISKRLQ